MIEHSQSISIDPDYAALKNHAVARCLDAFERTRAQSKDSGKGMVFSTMDASRAFRKAMPPLSGADNIRDFIACTAYGMLLGAIDAPDGSRLLYAAQVARGALQPAPK